MVTVCAHGCLMQKTAGVARTNQLMYVFALLRYECKEPEPGKFTLAFRRLDQAVEWATRLQVGKARVHWHALYMDFFL